MSWKYIIVGVFGVSVGTAGLEAVERDLGNEEVEAIFYGQALSRSWELMVERILEMSGDQRESGYKSLVELAFRYWCYRKESVIRKDIAFENQLYCDLNSTKSRVPARFLDDPISGVRFKRIPGFQWTLEEYRGVRKEFEKFILDLQEQELPRRRVSGE